MTTHGEIVVAMIEDEATVKRLHTAVQLEGLDVKVELRHVDVETAHDQTVVVVQMKGTTDATRQVIGDLAALPAVGRVTEEEAAD